MIPGVPGARAAKGITLVEMLIVVMILSLMVGITFPSVSSGIDSLRLSSASDSIVSFLNAAVSQADRRQMPMELTVFPADARLVLRSVDPRFFREISLPEGVTIQKVLPEIPGLQEGQPRLFLLHPGGTVPRIGLRIRNRRGAERVVRVDPITGVPEVERLEGK